jgi:uncharacterized protein YecE (DUF72 family)
MPGLTTPLIATADFAYIRFHGSTDLYGSYYSEAKLEEWASHIAKLGQGLTAVYIYFNNDSQAFATSNAKTLAKQLASL